MRTTRRRSTTGLALAVALSAGPGIGAAQPPPAPARAAAVSGLESAMRETNATGRPTVVVVTSATEPASLGLLPAMLRVKKAQELARSVRFVQADLAEATRLGVATAPGLAVCRKGNGRLEVVRSETRPRDEFDAVGWLCTLRFDAATVTPAGAGAGADPEVARAGHLFHHPHVQPSAQAPPPVYAAPPQVATPQPTYVQQPAPPPMVTVSAPTTPVVTTPSSPVMVTTSSQPIVFQQSAPTIYVAPPSQPANVVVLAPAPTSPTVSVVQPTTMVSSPGPQQSQQLFVTSPGPSVSSPNQPSGQTTASAPPPQPVQMVAAPVQYQMMAASPAPAAANPTVSLGATEAIPAGPLGRALGNFGERLSRHKYPRVRGATTTHALAQPANVALATVPVAVQQNVSYVQAPQPVASTPYVASPPPPPPSVASPQGHWR